VWQAAIMGFAGLRHTPDGYTTNPSLPDGWTRLAFKWCHNGQLVEIDLKRP
jgi:trehalose/maltose hydrolase-like predicted phosphorylase